MRGFCLSFVLIAVLFAVPFVSVKVPPITDLPQQIGQIYLLHEGTGEYQVRGPHHPNKLSYLVLAWWYWLAGPIAAGKLTVYSIGVAWLAAVHLLAFVQGRTSTAAALAGLIFFNHSTYWGFLNFTLGFVVFVAWFLLLRSPSLAAGRVSVRSGLALLIGSMALFSAHILWLVTGVLWMLIATMRFDVRQLPEVARRLLWISPLLAGVAWWWSSAYSRTPTSLFWGLPPWQRFDLGWLIDNFLGGLRGPVEPLIGAVLLGAGVLGLVSSRSKISIGLAEMVRRPASSAGLAGGLLLLLALVLPTYLLHTTAFAGRWLPPAVVFLIVSWPSPVLRHRMGAVLAWVVVAAFVATTTAAWRNFEAKELDGLEQCFDALPLDQRLLGLAFESRSEFLAGYPFHHVYAWAQPLRGAELNRSFANEAVALVTYRDYPREVPWTDGLDFYPRRFTAADRDFFDYIVVLAGPQIHAQFAGDPNLETVTAESPWRLYRVKAPVDP